MFISSFIKKSLFLFGRNSNSILNIHAKFIQKFEGYT